MIQTKTINDWSGERMNRRQLKVPASRAAQEPEPNQVSAWIKDKYHSNRTADGKQVTLLPTQ
jgi:hypothetical protein